MRWIVAVVASTLVGLAMAGCGGTAHAPPVGDDPAPRRFPTEPAHGASSSATQKAACNAVEPRAEPVTTGVDPTPYPNFEGGTIEPGTYVAVRIALHDDDVSVAPGVLFPGLDETLVIDATTVQAVNVDGATAMRWSARWATLGTTLRWARTCPDREVVELGYTATETELRIGLQSLGSDLEVVYRRID